MKILFTGHKGFLGRELIPHLSREFEVFTFESDLRNHDELSEFVNRNSISHVIHAAAKVANRWDADSSNNLIQNLQITMNIVELGLPVLTFCSGRVYGYQKSIDNVDESNAGERYPTDFYGQGKFILRKLVEGRNSVKLLRYFNVFGVSEDPRKFIKANLIRYRNKEPMIIDQNIMYDFFYVVDSLPIIKNWIQGIDIPKETNLVYSEKFRLSDVCDLINKLDDYSVGIVIKQSGDGKNYFGNGHKFNSMRYPLVGLEKGLSHVYQSILYDRSF